MTDSAPAGEPENTPETADAPAHAAQEEKAPPPVDMSEEGVALHFMVPHDPGTILVAVAEPADMHSGSFASGGDAAPTPEPVVSIPSYGNLTEVAAVRLGGLGPALFFTTNGVECAPGDQVIVEMEEGQAFGEVAGVMRMIPAHMAEASGEEGKVRPLVRKATEKDAVSAESNRSLAAESFAYCRECVRERDLDMKLVDVLILHDRSKMIFYFTAPARIDFRELVKDLVRRYRTRIELRQIGVRHETQMVGALGNCGMACCCRRYLRKFAPVAIKMAKEQNVFLNPVKISGICGRLLCCLAYEQEHYDEFYRSCPKLGKKYHTDAGVYRVLRASLFRESVTVLSETGEEREYPLAEWNSMNPFRPNALQQQQPARKQDRPESDGRSRKNGGRPAVSPTARHSEKSSGDAGDDMLESADFFVREERTVITEKSGAVVAESSSVTAVFAESLRPVNADGEFADNAFEASSDDGDGSIFGLSPRRSVPDSGQDASRGGNREGGNWRKPHRRRKPRSPES